MEKAGLLRLDGIGSLGKPNSSPGTGRGGGAAAASSSSAEEKSAVAKPVSMHLTLDLSHMGAAKA